LLGAADGFGKVGVAPDSGACFVPVQQVPVEFFHVAVQGCHAILFAEPDPKRRAGHFERSVDQRQDVVAAHQRHFVVKGKGDLRRLRRGRVFSQLISRHRTGLEVSLSGLTDFTSEEMSHIAGILHRQTGPVNEQALLDCIRIIQDENQSAKTVTDDDLLARQARMKQRKGIKA